jgi:hypothetical protein
LDYCRQSVQLSVEWMMLELDELSFITTYFVSPTILQLEPLSFTSNEW